MKIFQRRLVPKTCYLMGVPQTDQLFRLQWLYNMNNVFEQRDRDKNIQELRAEIKEYYHNLRDRVGIVYWGLSHLGLVREPISISGARMALNHKKEYGDKNSQPNVNSIQRVFLMRNLS